MLKMAKGLILLALGIMLLGGLASAASTEEKPKLLVRPGVVTMVDKVYEIVEVDVKIDDKTVVKEKIVGNYSGVKVIKYGREIPIKDLDQRDQAAVTYSVDSDGKRTLARIEVIMQ